MVCVPSDVTATLFGPQTRPVGSAGPLRPGAEVARLRCRLKLRATVLEPTACARPAPHAVDGLRRAPDDRDLAVGDARPVRAEIGTAVDAVACGAPATAR